MFLIYNTHKCMLTQTGLWLNGDLHGILCTTTVVKFEALWLDDPFFLVNVILLDNLCLISFPNETLSMEGEG